MRIVCGLEVHKGSIYLCILSSTGDILEQVLGILTTQLKEMRDLMLKYNVQEDSCYFRRGNDIWFL